MSSFNLQKKFSLNIFLTNLLDFTKTIIPLALIASESIAHEARGIIVNYFAVDPGGYF